MKKKVGESEMRGGGEKGQRKIKKKGGDNLELLPSISPKVTPSYDRLYAAAIIIPPAIAIEYDNRDTYYDVMK